MQDVARRGWAQTIVYSRTVRSVMLEQKKQLATPSYKTCNKHQKKAARVATVMEPTNQDANYQIAANRPQVQPQGPAS